MAFGQGLLGGLTGNTNRKSRTPTNSSNGFRVVEGSD